MKMKDAWYIFATRQVLPAFVGSGADPLLWAPMKLKIQKRMGLEQPKHKIDYKEGDVVH